MGRALSMAAIFFLLAGCSAQLQSPLLDAKGNLDLPWFPGEEVQVVFPAGTSGQENDSNMLTRLYGPEWKDLQDEYEEYRFNGGQ